MYDFKYVKKRKTKIWVTIGAGISTLVVATFVIVSFLGRFVGTFTVKLEAGVIALTLSEKHTFEKKSSYLRISQLPIFEECEYATLVERVGDDALDSDETNYLYGANYNRDGVVKSLDYFKYTFFVKNVGDVPCTYDLHINILDSKSDNGILIEDTLRFMIYDNYYEDNAPAIHANRTVYAKRSLTTHEDDDEKDKNSSKEKISTDEYGYAEEFESDKKITTLNEDFFDVEQIKRYTLVMWLEGHDPDSDNKDAPKNARLKIGVEINAYEI